MSGKRGKKRAVLNHEGSGCRRDDRYDSWRGFDDDNAWEADATRSYEKRITVCKTAPWKLDVKDPGRRCFWSAPIFSFRRGVGFDVDKKARYSFVCMHRSCIFLCF